MLQAAREAANRTATMLRLVEKRTAELEALLEAAFQSPGHSPDLEFGAVFRAGCLLLGILQAISQVLVVQAKQIVFSCAKHRALWVRCCVCVYH